MAAILCRPLQSCKSPFAYKLTSTTRILRSSSSIPSSSLSPTVRHLNTTRPSCRANAPQPSRPHPLSQGRPTSDTGGSQHQSRGEEPKFTPRTVIACATFVGTAAYLIGRSRDNSHSQNSDVRRGIEDIQIPHPSQQDFDAALKRIRSMLPEDCITTEAESLESCVAPWSYQNPAALPGAVVYPRSTEDVQRIVKVANEFSIPLIPFSGLTSLEGHVHAPNLDTGTAESYDAIESDKLPKGRAWCLSFSENMNNIVELHKDDLDVIVQPGMPYEVLNNEIAPHGLFFATDPGPGAQIGGMVGTGASGTNAVRFGTMRENVLYLTVVLADGTVVKTRQRARKSSAGPNLGQLFIGSEGTLGIVTEICLKLQPTLPYTVAVASFPGIEEAASCVRNIVQHGIQLQCVELMDDLMVKCTNEYAKSQPHMRQWPVQPALFFKFSGNDKQLAADVERTAELVKANSGGKLVFAQSEKEKQDLWYARKVALWSALDYRPGSKCVVTDVCVPISKLPTMVSRLKQDLDELNLVSPIVGHVGDGNIHAFILFKDDEEKARAKKAVHRMVDIAQQLDGTCTGEHGVGLGKKSSLEAELGPGTIALLRRLKVTLDPKGILNPFKLYP